MSYELLFYIVAGVLLLETVRSHLTLSKSIHISKTSPPLADYPSVSVIRPIKGIDAEAKQNLKAALETGYPGDIETLFVFDDPDEPAVPLAEAAIKERLLTHPQENAHIIFSGEPPVGRTGKLHAMKKGLEEAKNALIVFADSDIRPDKNALRVLVDTLLGTRGAGSAFAPVVVPVAPQTVGDAGYSLLLNGLYGPAAASAAAKHGGELPFIMGQFMVFYRGTLSSIGGIESADGQLVDDMYLGTRVKALNLKNVVSPHPVPVIQYGLNLKDFWKIYLRWITFSRTGLPGRSFKMISWLHGAVFFGGLVASGVSALMGYLAPALLLLLAPVGVAASLNRLHRELGGASLSLKHYWVSFAVMLIAPFVMLNVLFRRHVEWRGRTYDLDSAGRLSLVEAETSPSSEDKPITETT